jgi:hypothetical protein
MNQWLLREERKHIGRHDACNDRNVTRAIFDEIRSKRRKSFVKNGPTVTGAEIAHNISYMLHLHSLIHVERLRNLSLLQTGRMKGDQLEGACHLTS